MQEQNLLTLAEAAQKTPGRVSAAAVWRWSRKGIKARSGTIVNLEHIRVGGKLYTSAEALDRFFRATAQADSGYFDAAEEPSGGPDASPPHDDSRPRSVAKSEAESILKDAGI